MEVHESPRLTFKKGRGKIKRKECYKTNRKDLKLDGSGVLNGINFRRRKDISPNKVWPATHKSYPRSHLPHFLGRENSVPQSPCCLVAHTSFSWEFVSSPTILRCSPPLVVVLIPRKLTLSAARNVWVLSKKLRF